VTTADEWYWCTRHEQVERAGDTCADKYLLGPYATAEAARNWQRRRDAREDRWEAQDRAWGSGR
jgi:hypothetical protein